MPKQRAGMKEEESGQPKEPQARRQNIVNAALHLFAQKGVAATSIRDISRLSGESISTVYYYFDDKDDLFRSVMVETALSGIAPIIEQEQETEGNALARLRGLLAAYMKFIDENREPGMMLIRGLLRILEHENTPFVQVIADRFVAIAKIIREGQEKGEIADIDPALFTYNMFGLVFILFFSNLAAETVEGWPYGSYNQQELLAFAERTLFASLET